MQFAHKALSELRGQTFYKLMGSGRGAGFNPLPDWSVYALLQVWNEEQDAEACFAHAEILRQYRARASEMWTVYMKNMTARGTWSGANPFQPSLRLDPANTCVAVITRATIKWHKLIPFWHYVPTSQRSLDGNPGLLFTKGIGEAPIVQMATFSLWRNLESLNEYAYRSTQHSGAIRKTRDLQWYSEEMFSRFQPYREEGTWTGVQLEF